MFFYYYTCLLYYTNHIYLKKSENMEYKRVSRHPSEATKNKTSTSLTGRITPDYVRQKISQSLKAYWSNDDNFPADRKSGITIQDIML